MSTRRRRPRTPTQRSKARYQRAAATLPPITLDEARATRLAKVLARTKETRAAWVRRKIDEEDAS